MADISRLVLEVDSRGVADASDRLDRMGHSAKDAERHAAAMEGGLAALNVNALASATGVAALSAAVAKLAREWGQFVRQGLADYSSFEQMELGLSSMLGSVEKGKAFFEELRTFSNQTTFGVDTLASASSQLLALGVNADDVKDRLAQLGDIAGGSTEKFDRLVEIYTKIQATGKASAIYLNQLSALTGVSWLKVLDDAGVKAGKATADDITAAIVRMTEAGGKFHGRMNSIIDTIEGKEGFIRDTAKEIRVLWTDATGKADAYKSALDVVYDAQYKVLQVLKDIAGDETAKNILSYAYAGGVIAIGTALTAGLIPAIVSFTSKLAVVKAALSFLGGAMLNPYVLAVTGIATAVGLLAKASMDATAETRKWRREYEELADAMKEAKGGFSELMSPERKKEYYAAEVSQLEQERAMLFSRLGEIHGAANGKEPQMMRSYLGTMSGEIEDITGRLDANLMELERARNDLEVWDATAGTAVSAAKPDGGAAAFIDEAYFSTPQGGREKALGELEAKRAQLAGYVAGGALSAEELERAKVALYDIYRQIAEIEAPQGESVPLYDRLKIDETTDKLHSAKEVLDSYLLSKMQSGSVGEQAEGFALNAAVSQSSDAQAAVQGFATGGPFGAVFGAVMNGVSNVISDIDGFGEAMNPITTIMEQLHPTLEQIGRILEGGTAILKMIGNVINAVLEPFFEGLADLMDALQPINEALFNLLSVVLIPLRVVMKALGAAFSWLGEVIEPVADMFDFLFGWIGDLFGSTEEEEEEEKERLEALNEEYATLLELMTENEEYYQQKKTELAADSYTRAALGVNDMILTPHGNFSTHPDDTIIAMKNPERLAGGGGCSVTVNNYGSDEVDVQSDGLGEIIVNISKKIAGDYANGRNGWDGAYAARSLKSSGRAVMA